MPRNNLSQLPGLRDTDINLLHSSGIRNTTQLAEANPIALHFRMREAHASGHAAVRLPCEARTIAWVREARKWDRDPG